MTNRNNNDVEHWKSQKKQAEKQLKKLTTDPVTGRPYSRLFQKELEHRIAMKYPTLSGPSRYKIYTSVRQAVHNYFRVDTRTMTKEQYIEALRFIGDIDL